MIQQYHMIRRWLLFQCVIICLIASVFADPTLVSLQTWITESSLTPAFDSNTYAYTQLVSSIRTSFYASATSDCPTTCRIVAVWNNGAETIIQSNTDHTPIYSIG